jgi:glycosyltransferase involved in cell wall biosynthesis
MLLSAVIITYNESKNIARCLASLQGVVDEIVIVDSYSTDDTATICQQFNVQFIEHEFIGHIEQKNWAMQQATHDWILSLDADEALSPALKSAILLAKKEPLAFGYTMNRLTNYCGQWIRHSGWYPDRKLRFFNRQSASWGGTNPHDRIEMATEHRIQHLEGDLLHYSYYSVAEHFERAKRYAQIAAQAMAQQGLQGAWWKPIFHATFKFIRNYFIKLGFLDGRAGFTICRISALETWWKYQLLREYSSL